MLPKKGLFFLLSTLLIASASYAQNKPHYYLVTFKDKNNSKYSVQKPQEFLSKRAIERRKRQGIKVDVSDLPVNEKYVKQTIAKGVKLHYTTKWLNGVIVSSEKDLAAELRALSVVSEVTDLGQYALNKTGKPADASDETIEVTNSLDLTEFDAVLNYGPAAQQAQMLNIDKLHNMGYRGQGIWVAVFDAGFRNANRLSVFDSLFKEKRFLGAYDVIDEDLWVFSEDNHGTEVLSCMASLQPGIMTGTAPYASYFLFRTENADVEIPLEEACWLIAAEKADSMGIDIVNSSLGYTRFDNSATYGHNVSDLNGYSSIATRAANFAWSKGMVMVNSAGNEGDGSWQYVGCPADAIGTISVAAVTSELNRAYFSSYGKTNMARQKPDLAALGANAVVCLPAGYISTANGTSFASPILCGAITSLMSASSGVNPIILRHFLYESASNFNNPDLALGYGIPDFEQCYLMLNPEKSADKYVYNWPADSTVNSGFVLKTLDKDAENWEVTYYDENNNLITVTNFSKKGGRGMVCELSPDLYPGVNYTVKFSKDGETFYTKNFSLNFTAPVIEESDRPEGMMMDKEPLPVMDESPKEEKK